MTTVLYEKRGRIAHVTLNRPQARNAINREMHETLLAVWRDFAADPALDVAILSGAGEAFCAGMDLKTFVPEYVGASAAKVMAVAEMGLGGITRGMHRLEKPVIAAVNGWALAAGFELALAADIRIASENAAFGSFEARRGFHHGDGGIPRLVNICGAGAALELVLTAEPVGARRALELGMVTRVTAPERLLEEAERVAAGILRNSQDAVRSAKKTVLDMIGRPLDDQLHLEAIRGYACMASVADVPQRLAQFYARTDPGRAGRPQP